MRGSSLSSLRCVRDDGRAGGKRGAFSGGAAAAESLFICTARGVIPNGVRNLIPVREYRSVEEHTADVAAHPVRDVSLGRK